MKKKTNKNNFFKTSILIVVTILSLYLIFTSLNISLKSKKTILNYQEDAQINYKVYLKPNNDYSSSYLEEGKAYVSNLISEIVPTFNYNFLSDGRLDLIYDYDIKANLYAYDKDKEIIWQNDYQLVPKTTSHLTNNSGYKIKESLSIDYDYYYNIIKEFQVNHNVSLNSVLVLTLTTNVTGNYEDSSDSITNSSQITMEIPLNEGSIKITTNDDVNNKDTLKKDESTTFRNKKLIILGSVLLIASISLLAYDGYKAYKTNKQQTKLHDEVENILKKYSKIMLRTNSVPNLKNKRTIEVASLNDLIELEKELKTGILVYEKSKSDEIQFIIIHQNEAWIYKKSLK